MFEMEDKFSQMKMPLTIAEKDRFDKFKELLQIQIENALKKYKISFRKLAVNGAMVRNFQEFSHFTRTILSFFWDFYSKTNLY